MYTFANQTGSIPLSHLDDNFTEVEGQVSSINGEIVTIDGQITTIQSDITTLQGQVAGINVLGLKNRIINGNMNIAQRGTSFSGVTATGAATYFVDRFYYNGISGGAGIVTVSQDSSVPSSNEFLYSAKIAVTTADSSISSSDYYAFSQHIEGYNVRDLIGNTFTLSFWVKSSVTGTYCVSFRNNTSGTPNRSWVSTYTISSANTWEYKTITVTGGLITAGTWDWTNGGGLGVGWALAAGTTWQTTAGAWNTGNYLTTSGQVNAMGTIGNVFAITGVQLEKSSTATSFEYRPYGLEVALCNRYYQHANFAKNYLGFGASSLDQLHFLFKCEQLQR